MKSPLAVWDGQEPQPPRETLGYRTAEMSHIHSQTTPAARDREERTHTHPHRVIRSQVCLPKQRAKLTNIAP